MDYIDRIIITNKKINEVQKNFIFNLPVNRGVILNQVEKIQNFYSKEQQKILTDRNIRKDSKKLIMINEIFKEV